MPVQPLSDELLENVTAIAKAAGTTIAQYFRTGYQVESKSDNSPLTTADLAAHQLITQQLTELHPQFPMLSEESTKISFDIRRQWETYWLIDPLDGTREFVKGVPEFTVNIALIHQHRPVLGVVNLPMQNTSYMAISGQSAYRENPDGSHDTIRTRSVPQHRPTVCGSRSHAGKSLKIFLEKLGDHELLSKGSSIKSCLVAEGSADIYPRFGPTSEWDTAASQCIVETAGGATVDMKFNPLRYNTKDSLLNPNFVVIGDTSAHWTRYF